YLIDAKHGGWFSAGLDTNPEARKRPKVTLWKDCTHETEALLHSLLMLDSFSSLVFATKSCFSLIRTNAAVAAASLCRVMFSSLLDESRIEGIVSVNTSLQIKYLSRAA